MTKQKLFFAAFVASVIGCGTTVGQAPMISIPIVNPDFEAQDATGGAIITDPAGCGTALHDGLVTGWISSGAGVSHWTCDDGMPTSNVVYLAYGPQGTSITQVTNETARPGVYVLQFDVSNWFYSYPGDWNALLYQAALDPNGSLVDANGNRWTLSPAPFCNDSGWAEGDMKRMTVVCDLPGYLIYNGSDSLSVGGQVKGNIAIRLQNHTYNPALGGHAGWPVIVDNVALGFSPSH